jgi:NTE family protein
VSADLILPSVDETNPEQGIGLSLSGGGYRAMIFHAGSIWRRYEANLLDNLERISSVSRRSITAAHW